MRSDPFAAGNGGNGERKPALALRRHLVTIAALAATSVVALAGCGGSSGDEDEDSVRQVIEQSFTEPDPEHCTTLATQKYLDQVEPGGGEEAVESCERDAENPDVFPDTVDLSEIEVEGPSATTTVAFEGGSGDGQTAVLELIEEDGQWKLDSVEDVEIDRVRFEAAVRREVTGEEIGLSEGEADCMLDRLNRVSTSELEAAALDGDRIEELVAPPLITCVGEGDPRAGVLEIARRNLVRGGLTHAQANCVVRKLRDDVNAKDVDDLLSGRTFPGLEAAAEAAARSCVVGNAPVPPPDEGDEEAAL
jgi:hypothetical protein